MSVLFLGPDEVYCTIGHDNESRETSSRPSCLKQGSRVQVTLAAVMDKQDGILRC